MVIQIFKFLTLKLIFFLFICSFHLIFKEIDFIKQLEESDDEYSDEDEEDDSEFNDCDEEDDEYKEEGIFYLIQN